MCYSEKPRMPLPSMSIDRIAQFCFLVFNRADPSACQDDIVADRALRLHDFPVNH